MTVPEDIGWWVRLPDGRVGQIWALAEDRGYVWVAVRNQAVRAHVDELLHAQDGEGSA